MSEALEAWLRWLSSQAGIDMTECTCLWEWRTVGALEGKGWVRMTTAADCPHHA